MGGVLSTVDYSRFILRLDTVFSILSFHVLPCRALLHIDLHLIKSALFLPSHPATSCQVPLVGPFSDIPIIETQVDMCRPIRFDIPLCLGRVETAENLHVLLVKCDDLDVLGDTGGSDRFGEDDHVPLD